uniref:Secreted protein n=1 Tax=Panagrellus redivivus TaxID=6233 RepID=A0A7E4ZRE1_PANRE
MHLSLALPALCLIAFIPYSEACAASGICGLQPYCYGSTPYYGQYPSSGSYQQPSYGGYQQPAYANSCGRCATSYGCGQYGCYRMRAAGSNTFSPERAPVKTPLAKASHPSKSRLWITWLSSHRRPPGSEVLAPLTW